MQLLISLNRHRAYEILVLDNSSKDNTVKLIQELDTNKIRFFNNERNLGFSKANNILIKTAVYDNIVLLNPDVFGFNENIWSKVLNFWDHENPMFVKLLNEDGSFQDCVGDVCGIKRVMKNFTKKIDYESINEPVEIEMGIMAFMIAPRVIFERIGLLSEEYHMYAEDMDWCYRALKQGYKIIFDPRIQLTHIGGASAKVTSSIKQTNVAKYHSQKKFINIHYKGINRILSLLLTNIMIMRISFLSK